MLALSWWSKTALATCAALLAGAPTTARGERASALVIGPELRTRAREGAGARYELAIPHGLISASGQTAFLLRLGALLPAPGGPLAFPATAGMRWAPFDHRFRPVLGTDLGGYFVMARGPRENASPEGPEWLWSARALAGLGVKLGARTSLLVYLDGNLVQVAQDARSRDHVFSSLGGGVELSLQFAPESRVFGMLLHGTNAPKGF